MCLALPAMQTALHQLGYNSYHVVEAGRIKTFPYWLEALRAMYLGDGQLYKRAEFDKLLGNFSVRGLITAAIQHVKYLADWIRLSLIFLASCSPTNS